MATIICQRCGEKTSTAICSSCGYINDTTPKETNNYQSSTSFAFSSQGGYGSDAHEAFQAYENQTAGGKIFKVLKVFSMIPTIALGVVLALALIFVGLATPDPVALIVGYISAGVCAILTSLIVFFTLANQIVGAFTMRSFCKSNNLTIREPNDKLDNSVHFFNKEKSAEQAKNNKKADGALAMYNAYRLTKSVKNTVVHCIYLWLSNSFLYGALSSFVSLPILVYSLASLKYVVKSDFGGFLIYTVVTIVAIAITVGIANGIANLLTKIVEKIANAIMDK